MSSNRLGKRILAFRQKWGLSQKQLAQIVHVGPATISRWETGNDTPGDEARGRLEVTLATYNPGSNGVTSPKSNGTHSDDDLALAYARALLAVKRAEAHEVTASVAYDEAQEKYQLASTAFDEASRAVNESAEQLQAAQEALELAEAALTR